MMKIINSTMETLHAMLDNNECRHRINELNCSKCGSLGKSEKKTQ